VFAAKALALQAAEATLTNQHKVSLFLYAGGTSQKSPPPRPWEAESEACAAWTEAPAEKGTAEAASVGLCWADNGPSPMAQQAEAVREDPSQSALVGVH
jgi:sulfur relay (sulfurtransferase) complex TusBCD TusD component (DsrE family)